jgi:hypothetical protein
MNLRTMVWVVAAFTISFFAVGLPYWQIPYAKVSLPSTLYGTGLIVVGVVAAAVRTFGKAHLLTVILAIGAAVPAPILARIAVDTAKDPTIAAVIGILVSAAGALLGSLPAFLSRHNRAA